jgi:hypothetical protein
MHPPRCSASRDSDFEFDLIAGSSGDVQLLKFDHKGLMTREGSIFATNVFPQINK